LKTTGAASQSANLVEHRSSVGLVANLTNAGSWIITGTLTAGKLHLSSRGTVTDPAYAFTVDPDTGIFSPGVNLLSLVTQGAERIRLGANGEHGFFGVTPVARPSAYTQTYTTADKTHATPTAASLTDNSAGVADQTVQAMPDPADTPASADALRDDLVLNFTPAVRNNVAELADEINKLVTDLADVKQLVNAVIDDLQALGLAQ
jgi:hypothetical protein